MAFRDWDKKRIQTNSIVPWGALLHWNDIPSALSMVAEYKRKEKSKEKPISKKRKSKRRESKVSVTVHDIKKSARNGRLYFNALDLPKATSDVAPMVGYK